MKNMFKKLKNNTIIMKQRGRNGNYMKVHKRMGTPDGSAVKNPPANAGDVSSIPGSGRSLEKKMATHSCLGNPTDRGAQRATVHGVAKELD